MKKLVIAACLALGATVAVAAEHGSAAEARAMLEKAVAAISTDKATALGQIARGEAGFKDRDLYPFCGGPDGNFTAHPSLTGKSMKGLVDKAGEPVGQKLYAAAAEGMGASELLRIFRRQARASLYIDRMITPMLRPSRAELETLHRSAETPFRGQPFRQAEPLLRNWYISRRLSLALQNFFQNVRARVHISLL